MSTEHIVQLLIQERDRLNRAIEALSGSTGKRRGRPPKNPLIGLPVAAIPEATAKKRKPFSAATKRKMKAAQKKRWAAIKAAK
jgi:hypothetical protein